MIVFKIRQSSLNPKRSNPSTLHGLHDRRLADTKLCNLDNVMNKCKIFYYIACSIGTLIIAISGIVLASQFNISKDKQIEIIQTSLKDKRELFMESSNILNSRFFDYIRIVWAIENIKNKQDINDNLLSKLKNKEKNYINTVRKYNIDVRKISKQITYVFSDKISNVFSMENDDAENPVSISGKFMKTHSKMTKLLENIFYKKDINYANQIRELQKENNELQIQIIKFLDDIAKLTFDKNKMIYGFNIEDNIVNSDINSNI